MPRTATTQNGITVDASIVDHINRVSEFGLTPRGSCSGLDRDHPESELATPSLLVQAAPTQSAIPSSPSFPPPHRTNEFVTRLQTVAETAGWNTRLGIAWGIYPVIVFRRTPRRETLVQHQFGPDSAYEDLSESQQNTITAKNERIRYAVSNRPDTELMERWETLVTTLADEFALCDLPTYDDKRTFFENEIKPTYQRIMPHTEDEMIDFPTTND